MTTGLVLAIESSNPPDSAGGFAEVALARVQDKRVDEVATVRLERQDRHDDALMPSIERLLRDAGAAPSALDAVAVSVGPGGYTAVRIACATAATIADSCGARLLPTPTSLVGAIDLLDGEPLAVALASKGERAWVCVFSGVREAAASEARLGVDASAEEMGALFERARCRRLRAGEHLPAPIARWAGAGGVRLEPLRLSALACARAAMLVDPVDPAELAPVYPREPDAVRIWRERADRR